MAVVDGRSSGRKHVTHQDIAAMPDGPIKSLLLTAPPRHDYPACAIFRGGMCTCDEASEPVDNPPMPQSNKERQEALRARRLMLGQTEVRGIYLHPDLHAELKAFAKKLAKRAQSAGTKPPEPA